MAIVNEETRAQRKELLIEQGLTEAKALEALQEGSSTSSTIVQQPNRRWNVCAEEVGYFEGDKLRLQWWLDRVRSLWERNSDPNYRDPLIDVLPMCLKGSATDWYQALSAAERSNLTSWPAWETSLREYFSMDRSEVRGLADKRKWQAGQEEIADYFQDKLRLLRQAYPDKTDGDLVSEIKDGLPSALRLVVRTDLLHRNTPLNLLSELRRMEHPFMETMGIKRSTGGRATQKRNDTKIEGSKTSASGSNTRLGSLEDSFDIKNFSKVGDIYT